MNQQRFLMIKTELDQARDKIKCLRMALKDLVYCQLTSDRINTLLNDIECEVQKKYKSILDK
jgi:hypothetical protein